ncbi:hypothetical protein [Marinobacter sp. V034]|uniref:hypothetical protein n=1 Tax=Marinobacter sp. V034 TaxID=3459610 RepID=UPI004043B26E
MDDPKTVMKKEPRKSLFILLAAGLFTLIIGIVVMLGPGSGETDMGGNAGWVMILIGTGCIIGYVLARRQKPK